MLNAIVVSIRFILLILGGQKQVALENAALRQQLAVFKRNVPRPKLNHRDRLFWIGLCMIWQDWKSALLFVQPETVTSWHQKRFRWYWWTLSQPKQRPTTNPFGDPETDYSNPGSRLIASSLRTPGRIAGDASISTDCGLFLFELAVGTCSVRSLCPKKLWSGRLRRCAGRLPS